MESPFRPIRKVKLSSDTHYLSLHHHFRFLIATLLRRVAKAAVLRSTHNRAISEEVLQMALWSRIKDNPRFFISVAGVAYHNFIVVFYNFHNNLSYFRFV